MSYLTQIQKSLNDKVNEKKKINLPQYFQAFPGGYGEGDLFLGVRVPDQREIAKQYYKLVSLEEISQLLKDKYHEYRLTALFLMML